MEDLQKKIEENQIIFKVIFEFLKTYISANTIYINTITKSIGMIKEQLNQISHFDSIFQIVKSLINSFDELLSNSQNSIQSLESEIIQPLNQSYTFYSSSNTNILPKYTSLLNEYKMRMKNVWKHKGNYDLTIRDLVELDAKCANQENNIKDKEIICIIKR